MLRLPDATEFTDDPEGQDPVVLLRELKRCPQLLAPLLRYEAELVHDDGRNRTAGSWVLLYLGYVFSGETSLYKFCSRWRTSPLWQEAGFGDWQPDYNTVWLRFSELEARGLADVLREGGDDLIRRARRHEPRIGRDSFVDATAYEAHARLRHCCPDRAACRQLTRTAQTLRRTTIEQANAAKHRQSTRPIEDEEDHSLAPLPDDDPRRELLRQRFAARGQSIEGRLFFLQRDHVYQVVDDTSWTRAYDNGEFWIGGLLHGSICVLTGAPIALRAMPNREHEARSWKEVLCERHRQATGEYPARVCGDAAYSHRHTFAYNTERRIASIFPWRRVSGEERRGDLDRDDVDRHGVGRCRHCGGEGDVAGPKLGFRINGTGEPVVRFRCQLQLTDGCAGIQEMRCAVEPRLILPLSRLHPSYHAMGVASKQTERVWHHWRTRYAIAGKNSATRTKRRRSQPCQELRAQAARFIEWLRILMRHGWLASTRVRNTNTPVPVDGSRRLRSLLWARKRYRLDLPYGIYAHKAGFALDANPPPSE